MDLLFAAAIDNWLGMPTSDKFGKRVYWAYFAAKRLAFLIF
jgi:hypothetical protein